MNNNIARRVIDGVAKAELVDWLQQHLSNAERCLVIIQIPGEDNTDDLETAQFGFKHYYEISGFMRWADETWSESTEEGEK